jgi:hypothetical protein
MSTSLPLSLEGSPSPKLVKNLKTSSTKIVKNKGHSHFGQQNGYGAFSVSLSGQGISHFLDCKPGNPPSQDDIPGRAPIIAEKTGYRLR